MLICDESLYHSKTCFSQVDIFAQLQNASEAFRTYIRDGLAQVCNLDHRQEGSSSFCNLDMDTIILFWCIQVEKNAAAGRTPSSLPLSTPPPIASIPSPKFAPSPVHTKSVSSKTDCNEEDPFRVQGDSDFRLQSDQQTDRFQTSGLLPSPSSLHLDI